MDWIGSVVMLDLFTFMAPECAMKIGFTMRWGIQMVSPLILIGIAVQKTRHLAHQAAYLQGRSASKFYSDAAKNKMKAKSENMTKKKDALEQLSTTFLLAWYLTMLNKSLQPLACSRPEGASNGAFLDADPTIRCWEMGGSHMFIGIVGMLTFMAFGFLLPYTMREAIIRAASSKFVDSWELFEYALMGQKLVAAVSLAIPQKWWVLQWVLCFAGIGAVFTAQLFVTRKHGNGVLLPYQHTIDNQISMLTLVAEILVLGLGLMSVSLEGSAVIVESLFFAVVFGTLLFCALLAWRELQAEHGEQKMMEEEGTREREKEEQWREERKNRKHREDKKEQKRKQKQEKRGQDGDKIERSRKETEIERKNIKPVSRRRLSEVQGMTEAGDTDLQQHGTKFLV
jgi:hypothetical protein